MNDYVKKYTFPIWIQSDGEGKVPGSLRPLATTNPE